MFLFIADDISQVSSIARHLHIVGKKESHILASSFDETKAYIRDHSLKGDVCIIHGSFGTDFVDYMNHGFSYSMKNLVDAIHERNPWCRIIIHSNASFFPLPETIQELQADGFISPLTEECDIIPWLKALAQKGPVTPEEILERGRTIERISDGVRLDSTPRAYRYRSKEGE